MSSGDDQSLTMAGKASVAENEAVSKRPRQQTRRFDPAIHSRNDKTIREQQLHASVRPVQRDKDVLVVDKRSQERMANPPSASKTQSSAEKMKPQTAAELERLRQHFLLPRQTELPEHFWWDVCLHAHLHAC